MTDQDKQTQGPEPERPRETLPGKDELNLAEFPIALLSERAPAGVKTLEFKDQIFDSGRNKVLNRKLTIEGSETYGLPTAKDDEVILALIQLSKRRNFHDKIVSFTRYELIEVLGWPNTGQSYARIELALRRWVSVTLHYENAWWDKSEERWTSGAFHIIDEFELNDSRESSSQMTLLHSRITWSNRVFSSFVEGHLRNIRYDVYVKLRSSISKRMYRFLDKRFYHSRSISFELRDFAYEHIGLSRSYKDCGKLKEKLRVAIRELEEIGYIEPADPEARYVQEGRGRWRVTFAKRSDQPSLASKPAAAPPPALHPLTMQLISRGVSESTAVGLVGQHRSEHVEMQLGVFDWLVDRADRRIGKSPSGYLVKSITENYSVPEGFTTAAERERAAAAIQEQEASGRRLRQQELAEQRRYKDAQDLLRRQTPQRQAELEAEALAQASEAVRDSIAQMKRSGTGDGFLHRVCVDYVRTLMDADSLAEE